MTKTAFILSEVAYHFAHDIYRRLPCDRSVIPLAVYSDRQDAESEAERRKIKALRNTDIHCFGYCMEDLFHDSSHWRGSHHDGNLSRTVDILSRYGLTGWSSLREMGQAIKMATDEEVAQVADLLQLKFFLVTEVDDFRH